MPEIPAAPRLPGRRRDVLVAIARSIRSNGYAPTLREHGFITRRPLAPRAIALTEAGWRAVAGFVPAPTCPHCGGALSC